MKKLIIILLLSFTVPAFAQEYTVKFTKQETIESLREINSSFIQLNSSLMQSTKTLSTNSSMVLKEEFIDYMNEQLLTDYQGMIIIEAMFKKANVQDQEMLNEYFNMKSLMNLTSDLYQQLYELHSNNVQVLTQYAPNQELFDTLDMFIGFPIFKFMNALMNK